MGAGDPVCANAVAEAWCGSRRREPPYGIRLVVGVVVAVLAVPYLPAGVARVGQDRRYAVSSILGW